MLTSQNKMWTKTFYINLRKAYVTTSEYLLSKLPLQNKVLAWSSALNPDLRKKSTTFIAFQKFVESLPQIVPDSDKGLLIEEIRPYSNDLDIDELESLGIFSESKKNSRIDLDWWCHIFNIKKQGSFKYKLLPILVKALMTPFSGPLVEGSFNIMDDIVTEDRSVLTVENYEAISTVKYNLRKRKIKAIKFKPCTNMRRAIHTAHASYQQLMSPKKAEKVFK